MSSFNAMGISPNTVASEVMRIGRSRTRHAVCTASLRDMPPSRSCRVNSNPCDSRGNGQQNQKRHEERFELRDENQAPYNPRIAYLNQFVLSISPANHNLARCLPTRLRLALIKLHHAPSRCTASAPPLQPSQKSTHPAEKTGLTGWRPFI